MKKKDAHLHRGLQPVLLGRIVGPQRVGLRDASQGLATKLEASRDSRLLRLPLHHRGRYFVLGAVQSAASSPRLEPIAIPLRLRPLSVVAGPRNGLNQSSTDRRMLLLGQRLAAVEEVAGESERHVFQRGLRGDRELVDARRHHRRRRYLQIGRRSRLAAPTGQMFGQLAKLLLVVALPMVFGLLRAVVLIGLAGLNEPLSRSRAHQSKTKSLFAIVNVRYHR